MHALRSRLAACLWLLSFVLAAGCSDDRSLTSPPRPVAPSQPHFSLSAAMWSPSTPMTNAVAQATYGVISGKLYAAGGIRSDVSCCVYGGQTEVFDPSTSKWSSLAPMPTAVGYQGGNASAAVNGKLYAMGGCFTTLPGGTAVAQVYDPAADRWSSIASMPEARCLHNVVAANGMVYVLGGSPGGGTGTGPNELAVFVYDPSVDKWITMTTPMLETHWDAGAAVVGNTIYVIGGQNAGGGQCLTTVEALDLNTQVWSTKKPLPTARCYAHATTLNGLVYVVTGTTFGSCCVTEVDVYDPSTDQWTTAPQLPAQRAEAIVGVMNGALFVAGGDNTTNNQLYSGMFVLAGPDVTPPVITYTGNLGTYTVDQTIAITCTATDPAPGSGIVSSTCANINGPAYTFSLGTHTYSATATDGAGNVGSGSTSFTVQSTPGGLSAVTTRLVTNAGVASSLVSQLTAAARSLASGNLNAATGQIHAYIHLVQAQTGKSITAANAQILITLAKALLP